ncbi:MAG: carotenoid biosynthesis protein [Chloroflexota bacterium]
MNNTPNAYFVLYELTLFLQLAICLPHAWKHGRANLVRLFAGILFGVLLEIATIYQLQAYEYGDFLIMIFDVPLGIGIAWGCILYSVMEFSDASNLPYFARPALDALLALNIDLSLDAVAIRFGFWDWGQGLDFQYFGVPYANFWAWFWVIFFFSMGYRIFARRGDLIRTWVAPLAALIIGLLGVLGTNALITFVISWTLHPVVVFGLLLAALAWILAMRPRLNTQPVPALTFWVPAITHIYVLIAGLISGLILDPPFLLLVGLVMTFIAFYLHRSTLRKLFL